jgi:pimeloyl-ACP methyl ester carboxylesterase
VVGSRFLGRVLDRGTFWNIPAFIKSYEMPVPCHTLTLEGLEVWHVPGRGDGPTVLFCHGNAGHLRFPNVRRDRFLALHEAGANLWAFDYRGYGHSFGQPTEKGVYADARAVHALVREQHDESRPFVLFGRSLGGAVATYLATEVQCPDSLILESTFTSVRDVVASWTRPKIAEFMSYRFDSLARIPKLECPLYMIHGTHDRIVPYALGKQLWAACPVGSEFVSVWQAGHNNLQQAAGGLYEEKLGRWLK